MSEIIVEAEPKARDLFDSYASEHPDEASVELSKGADGITLVSLIVENAPYLSASLAMLIATLQRRGLRFRATRDGLELSVDEAGKPS